MIADSISTARESYGRCVLKPTFFEDFYVGLFKKTAEIPAMFSNTDMARQRQLLREGISYLLLYAENNAGGQHAIERIGILHNPSNVNVKPDLYRFWVQNLLETIEMHDHRFDDSVRAAWEEVVALGIKRFVEVYNQ